MKTGVDFSYFQSTEWSESLSTINLEIKIFSREERSEFHSLFDRRHCPKYCRRLTCKRQRFIRGETHDFTHFWSTELSETLSTIDMQKWGIHSEREKWISFTFIDGIVEIILDGWSTKDRGSFANRENWISVTLDRRNRPKHCRRSIYKRQIYSMRERQMNFTHFDQRELEDHWRRWI